MKKLPSKKRLVIACAHAMALMFAQQAISAEEPEKDSAVKISKKEMKDKGDKKIEIIEVTGYLSSIEKALSKKRFANGVVDAIIAEDIGKMADANVAEALQRVTGVSINREGGEGTTVSIRGLGPEMNQVSVNGQVITGGSDGGAVSFDTMSADMLSSIEIIKTPSASTEEGSLGGKINLNTVRPLDRKNASFTGQIKESYNDLADQVDPSVQLNYIDQFLDNSFGIAFGTTYERRRSRTDQVGTFGWAGSEFTHDTNGHLYMQDDAENIYRFDQYGANVYNHDGSASDVSIDNLTEASQLGYIPTIFNSSYSLQDRIRTGANFTVQYRPTDSLDLYFDASHTQLDTTRSKSIIRNSFTKGEKGLFSDDALNLYSGAEIDPESQTVTNLVNYKGGRNQTFQSQQEITNTTVANLGFEYDLDVWNIVGRLGYSKTTQEWLDDNRFIFASYKSLHGYSLEDNPQIPEYLWMSRTSSGVPMVGHPVEHTVDDNPYGDQLIDGVWYNSPNSTHNPLSQVWNNERDLDDSTITAQLDAKYLLDSNHLSAIKFGVKYTDRSMTRYQVENLLSLSNADSVLEPLKNSIYLDDGSHVVDFPVDNFLGGEGLSSGATQGAVTNWAFGDFNEINNTLLSAYNTLGLNANVGAAPAASLGELPWQVDFRESYQIDQQFLAGYVQVDVDTLDGNLVGDFGVRVVQTKNESAGFGGSKITTNACTYIPSSFDESACKDEFLAIDAKHDYTEILPTSNFRYLLSENLLTRVAIGRAMARPTMQQIAPFMKQNVSTNAPQNSNQRQGNPYLDPMTAWQYDLTIEWYFEKGGLLSAGLFYKDIDSFIYNSTEVVAQPLLDIHGNQYLVDYGEENLEPLRTYKNITAVNGESASILGLEASYSQSFDQLPGILSGLGVALNYTYADSQATYRGSNEQGEEISVDTAFQGQSKNTYNSTLYWEKYGHSMRLSYNYRTESLYEPISAGTQDQIWSDAYGQLDFAARFKVSDSLSFGFDAINLTDESAYRFHTNAWDGNPVDTNVYENRLGTYTMTGRTFRFTANARF